MLHILWLIIKWIFILLGILLGLILLAVLIVLLVPVRYQAQGERNDKGWRAEGGVTWLAHAVSVRGKAKNGDVDLVIRLFGLTMEQYKAFLDRFRKKSKKTGVSAHKEIQKAEKRKPLPKDGIDGAAIEDGERAEGKTDSRESEDAGDSSSKGAVSDRQAIETAREEAAKEVDRPPAVRPGAEQKPSGPLTRGEKKKIRLLWNKIKELFSKIVHFPQRIWAKIKKTALTIRSFCGKINQWKQFIGDSRVKAAIRLLLGTLKKLLKHAGPKKISGYVHFGMEDPASTGYVLAVVGATCPLHKNRVRIQPSFEEKVLEGEIAVKGRVYGVILLKLLLEVYFNKNFKYAWKTLKNKEG